jgi:hypothetical protein
MTPGQRYWLAGALLCVSVAGAQRVRAQEMEVAEAAEDAGALASEVAQPPSSPERLQPLDRQRRLERAEADYQARRDEAARLGFEAVVAAQGVSAQAWLRLGNLHQRAGHDAAAMVAYRNASVPREATDAAERLARGKALLNLAMLALGEATRALEAFDGLDVPVTSGLGPDRAAIAQQRQALTRRAADGAQALAAPASRVESDVGPHTVDRWVQRPRRAASPPRRARAAVVEPVTDAPLPAPPAVELLRGGLSGAGR